MTHIYTNTFFDYIDEGARRSAERIVGLVADWISPHSVLDLGCGRGVWLGVWRAAGADEVTGVDGDYVDRSTLAIPERSFCAADLTKPLALDRKFDIAQSLEVGEHLPQGAADQLVNSLTQSADIVLFSAAVTGQGGEFHINEQPLSYWQDKFLKRGYRAYDCLRPELRADRSVEPWYRFNSVLYANAQGAARLPDAVLRTALSDGEQLKDAGTLTWQMRRYIVRHLPQGTVTRIAQTRAMILSAKARGKAA